MSGTRKESARKPGGIRLPDVDTATDATTATDVSPTGFESSLSTDLTPQAVVARGVCGCGCGALANEGARYVRGHHRRQPSSSNPSGLYVVEDRGYDTPCWIWNSVDRYGYGRMSFRGRTYKAHRAMYEQHVGPIADGLHVDHLCRVRACGNPAHLRPLTNAENTQAGNGATLTPEQVAEIKSRLPMEFNTTLAREFGVVHQTISAIRTGKCWANIPAATQEAA